MFDELEAEAEATPEVPSEASAEAVRVLAQKAATLEARIERGEKLLKELKSERYQILNEQMPTMMDEVKMPYIGVDGYHMEVISYYKANIAADDPPEQRDRAFTWVELAGGGDIINNTVTVAFPKEMSDEAREFFEATVKKFHNHPEIQVVREKKVPWNRLTSWLKDYVTTPPVPGKTKLAIPLEDLNATLGRIVKIKPIKED